MKSILKKICFILQNMVSIFLCFAWLWLANYIPWIFTAMKNAIVEIKERPLTIFPFMASFIVVSLFVAYPITYIITLHLTLKKWKITYVSFLPTAQILVCIVIACMALIFGLEAI